MFINKQKTIKSRKGFSFAELIISIVIVAVVAKIAVPPLLNNIQQSEYNSQLQSIYLTLSDALDTISQQTNGNVPIGPLDGTTGSTFRNSFCNIMSCVKTGSISTIWQGINYSYYKGPNTTGWTAASVYTSGDAAAVLNNGTFLWFYNYGYCSPSNTLNAGSNINACGFINVDINGASGPNMLGEDAYGFWIAKNTTSADYSLIPMGNGQDGYSCTAPGTTTWATNGPGCTYSRLSNPNTMP